MTNPGGGGATSADELRLDLDAADEAVRALEDVRRQIETARARAVTLARTPPTAQDAISLEASVLLAQKADGGPGSFTAAMSAGLIHVDQLIDQMQSDIDRQRELDATADGFAGRE